MKKFLIGIFVLGLALAFASCSSANSFSSEGEQIGAAAAASSALGEAGLANSVDVLNAVQKIVINTTGATSGNCPKGGSWSMNVSSADSNAGTYTYTFDNCQVELTASDVQSVCPDKSQALDVTVDGSLDYTISLTSSYTADMTGSLTVEAGKLNGTCEYDLHMTIDASGTSSEVTGTICGYDASKFDVDNLTDTQKEEMCNAIF